MSQQRTLGTVTKDPDDKTNRGIDWDGDNLLTNRSTTIATSAWTVPVGLTSVAESNTTTTTLIRIGGGTDGSDYIITNHVVLANGEEYDRSIRVKVRSR